MVLLLVIMREMVVSLSGIESVFLTLSLMTLKYLDARREPWAPEPWAPEPWVPES